MERFLNSLSNNLLYGVEVILVDDGSKDLSGKIADDYARLYSDFVKVVHKPNGGISSARNMGLELATGKYVIFPDPDDYLHSDYVKEILSAIDTYNEPDLVFFDYYYGSYGEYKINAVPGLKKGFVNKKKFLKESFLDEHIKGMVWCKAIKKSLYNGLSFNVRTRVAEDYEILTDVLVRVKNIVYIPKPLYYYVWRENSLSNNASTDDLKKFYDIVYERYTKHKELCEDIPFYVLLRCGINLVVSIYKNSSSIESSKYENMIRNHIFDILISNKFSFNQKKQCVLISIGLARTYYKRKYNFSIKG